MLGVIPAGNADKIADIRNSYTLSESRTDWEITSIPGTDLVQICMPRLLGCLSFLDNDPSVLDPPSPRPFSSNGVHSYAQADEERVS